MLPQLLSHIQVASWSSAGSCKAMEPGYILLITCPETSYTTSRQATSLTVTTDFTSSMHTLCGLLEATLGQIWGSLPSAWSKVAAAAVGAPAFPKGPEPSSAPTARSGGKARTTQPASIHAVDTGGPDDGLFSNSLSVTRQAGLLQAYNCAQGHDTGFHATGRLPSHGLQITSNTRSLAAIQVCWQSQAGTGGCLGLSNSPERVCTWCMAQAMVTQYCLSLAACWVSSDAKS